jgi:hypothetical protein
MTNATEIKNKIPVKTGDFQVDVRAGYYQAVRNAHYDLRDQPSFCFHELPAYTFDDDFEQHLLNHGVPSQYVKKVAYAAYEQGHSSGYSEIVNCAWDLIAIFN